MNFSSPIGLTIFWTPGNFRNLVCCWSVDTELYSLGAKWKSSCSAAFLSLTPDTICTMNFTDKKAIYNDAPLFRKRVLRNYTADYKCLTKCSSPPNAYQLNIFTLPTCKSQRQECSLLVNPSETRLWFWRQKRIYQNLCLNTSHQLAKEAATLKSLGKWRLPGFLQFAIQV